MQNLNDALRSTQQYQTKKFKGTVIDNNDPLNQGRVKVSIPGLYDEGELPWVGIIRSSPFGHGPGFGMYGRPAIGAIIEVELQGGSAAHPVSSGYLADTSTGNSDFVGNTWGYKDPAGNQLKVDPDSGTLEFTHQSGTKYTFDASGNLTIIGSGTVKLQFQKAVVHSDMQVTGNLEVDGLSSLNGGMDTYGRTDGLASIIRGNVQHVDGLFTSNNVTISEHEHDTPDGRSSAPIVGT